MGDEARPLLHIPSHSQVTENSRPQPPPSFFRPSSSQGAQSGPAPQQPQGAAATSFTEAFSFVRQTEFYIPPPAPAPAPPPVAPSPSSGSDLGVAPRSQEYVHLLLNSSSLLL